MTLSTEEDRRMLDPDDEPMTAMLLVEAIDVSGTRNDRMTGFEGALRQIVYNAVADALEAYGVADYEADGGFALAAWVDRWAARRSAGGPAADRLAWTWKQVDEAGRVVDLPRRD